MGKDKLLLTQHTEIHPYAKGSYKNTNLGQQGVSSIGPNFWNIFPSEIKLSTSANYFKHAIKEDFFAQLQKTENYPFVYPQN